MIQHLIIDLQHLNQQQQKMVKIIAYHKIKLNIKKKPRENKIKLYLAK
jgi:hypothetical protein